MKISVVICTFQGALYIEEQLESILCQSRPVDEILLLDDYRQGGYGRYDERIESCIHEQYRRNGIPLDPVYTAKAFWGMQEYLKETGIKKNKILFLHTGGGPLFYDFLKKEGAKSGRC